VAKGLARPHVPAVIPRADARQEQRLAVRAPAELRFGAGRWTVIVEDFGERGCQVVSPFPLRRGEAVFLSVTLPGEAQPLACGATVAWAAAVAPYRTGVVFTRPGAAARGRLRRALLFRDPALGRAAPSLRPSTRLRLGPAPAAATVFTRAERAALRASCDGITAGALVAALAPHGADGRRAIAFLLGRGLLATGSPAAADARWNDVLPAAPATPAPPAPEPNPFAGPPPRPAAAQALLDLACAEGAAGRLRAAVEWLQAALAAAPGDPDVAAALDDLTLGDAHEVRGAGRS
jgi:hypothetical protein